MDRQLQSHEIASALGSEGNESCVQQYDARNPARDAPRADATPKPGLSDAAWFHILWFSAAMLGMPALMVALALLF